MYQSINESAEDARFLSQERDFKMDKVARLIQRFAEDPSSSDADAIASYGPAIVVPLLVAHEPHCNPDTREAVIYALGQIQQPIMDEIVEFMARFPDHYGARVTAFEALEERAVEDKEDLPKVIRFFQTLHNDGTSRIRDNVKYAIEGIQRTMRLDPSECPWCGRIIRCTCYKARTRQNVCGYCRYRSGPR